MRFPLLAVASLCLSAVFSAGQEPARDEVRSCASICDSSVLPLFNSLVNQQDEIVQNSYATVYFSNLRDNFGFNSHGTCSFVALGMLLSFYDSYWNEDFVPEAYEACSGFSSTITANQNLDTPTYRDPSPGILSEDPSDVIGLTDLQYANYVNYNRNTYLQFHLMDIADTLFNTYGLESSYSPFGLTYSEQISVLYNFLSESYIGPNTVTVQSVDDYDPDEIRPFIIDKVEAGTPVLVNAVSSVFGAHAMVAYDYDPAYDRLYFHAGWKDGNGSALTHVTESQLSLSSYNSAFALTLYQYWQPDANYESSSGLGYDSSQFALPRNVRVSSGNYRDMVPTFSWDSLYEEAWYASDGLYIQASFLNSNGILLFTKNVYTGNSMTLTASEWQQILDPYYDDYQVRLTLAAPYYCPFGTNWCVQRIEKPSAYLYASVIEPSDYSFSGAYESSLYYAQTFIDHSIQGGIDFQTRRYRVCYDSNSDSVVLSPKRAGYHEAYLEYRFGFGVSRIDLELSHWDIYPDNLIPLVDKAVVEAFYEGGYHESFDILAVSISSDRFNKSVFTVCFKQPVCRLRIYAKSGASSQYNLDQGRICLGSLAVWETATPILPMSGYELRYEPEEWNNSAAHLFNCYAYALDTKVYGGHRLGWFNPGDSNLALEDYHRNVLCDYISQSAMEELVAEDAYNCGFSFVHPIGAYDVCPAGTYKVALVLSTSDYHWYRQNSDGTWSHKLAMDPVRNTDYSDEIIYDPRYADIDEGFGYEFVAFYAVSNLPRYDN